MNKIDKPEIEELIDESKMQNIREKYFPLVAEGIITGYNMYTQTFDYSQGDLFLHYLHSDLTAEHIHFQELSEMLRQKGIFIKNSKD